MSSEAHGSERDRAISRFAGAARSFCLWVEEEPADDTSERFAALRLVSSLYSAALELPLWSDEQLSTSAPDSSRLAPELTERAMSRFDRFPERYYWRVEGTAEGGAETVQDDVARDLFLTYAAVKSALEVFDRGEQHRALAVWSWSFSFWLDWGKHSTHAIQALHDQFHKELNRDE